MGVESFEGELNCSTLLSGTGTIQLDYSFVDRDVVKQTGVFHSRQLFCDVFMTVHRALVAHSLEVLRLKPVIGAVNPRHSRTASVASLGHRGAALDKRLQDTLRGVGDQEQCLISVDVMNAYGQPFEVSLESCESEGASLHQSQVGDCTESVLYSSSWHELPSATTTGARSDGQVGSFFRTS